MLVKIEASTNVYQNKNGETVNGIKNDVRAYKTLSGATPIAVNAPMQQAAPITPTYAPVQATTPNGWDRGGQNPFGAGSFAADDIPF